jgi:ABC-2 type transport system permease protein
MNLKRVLAVSKRVFMDLRNDRRSLALIILAPLFAMAIFGLAFSGELKDVDVIIVNNDLGMIVPNIGQVDFADDVVSNINNETLSIRYQSNLEVALESLENGDAWAVIYFPENYTVNTIASINAQTNASSNIYLYIDMSNVNVAESIIVETNSAVMSTLEERGGGIPLAVERIDVYGQDAEFMDFFVPGIICFAVYLLTTLLTLMTFIGERISGTLSRVLATPLTESEIVAGYAISFSIVGTFQAVFLVVVGILAFDVMIVGNVFLAFLVVALLAVVCQALGILLSAFAQREAQAAQFLPFIVMPGFLLSGVFWPLEAIPAWLRPASLLVPPSYAIEATRSVMLRGWGLDMIWHQLVALVVFAGVLLLLAVISLKRRN